ncbi:MAG: multidrug ABC transporter [Lachnospiraceae bacterium]|nr:multidrug ABC transporter [Candidatus Colinaster equi]
MNKSLLLYSCLILLGTFISSVAQIFLKKAAGRSYSSWIKEYLNPTVIISYIVFFGATLLNVVAYKVVPLSLGPILEASSYIYVTIWGVTIFKEKMNIKKLIALMIIIAGIVVYAI